MSRLNEQILQQELESILHEITYHGFVLLPLQKLYRLLGKGNRAAGTWWALLDAWEGIGGERKKLHIVELKNETLIITSNPTEPVWKWSGE